MLRVLPDESNLSVDIQSGKLQIKTGKSKFSLQTLPAQDFPKASDQIEEAEKINIPENVFRKLLGSVQYAMAQQDIRYYLNGVLLIIDGPSLKVVATDGHRLAYANAKLENSYSKSEVILPRKCITELYKLLSDTDNTIIFEFSENQARITFADVVMTSKIID